MGGIANCGGCPTAWVGGKPNATWSGFKDPNAACVDSAQLQSFSPKSHSAAQARQAGLFPGEEAKQFKKGNDLECFVKLLCINFTENGLDAIACCRDPNNSTKMTNVLVHCAKLIRSQ